MDIHCRLQWLLPHLHSPIQSLLYKIKLLTQGSSYKWLNYATSHLYCLCFSLMFLQQIHTHCDCILIIIFIHLVQSSYMCTVATRGQHWWWPSNTVLLSWLIWSLNELILHACSHGADYLWWQKILRDANVNKWIGLLLLHDISFSAYIQFRPFGLGGTWIKVCFISIPKQNRQYIIVLK